MTSHEGSGRGDLLDLLIVLVRYKRFVLTFVAATAALSVAIVMVWPQYYAAETKILPPQQSQSIASAMLGQLGQLAPLIGAASGKDLGLRNPNDMYVAMLRSRTIADQIIDRFSLMSVYNKKRRVDARRRLDSLTEIDAGKDGVISVSVEDRDPRRATDIANAYIDALEKLTHTLAVTEASKRRLFFEGEMKMASDDLGKAELAMKQTQEKTGLIMLDSQSRAMIESVAGLRARVAAQEVVVKSMQSFATADNPDFMRAQRELAALRDQQTKLETGSGKRFFTDVAIENIPEAGLDYLRKLRELKYREALFELLAKQYQAARIDEAKDVPIIQVLDVAVVPERRSSPKRAVVVSAVTFLALLLAVVCVYVKETLAYAKADPHYSTRLQLLRSYLSHRGTGSNGRG
jgi:uncharacterized protein involved in exopolysaccharide biosynthesis